LTGVYGERSTWVALHNCIGTRTEEFSGASAFSDRDWAKMRTSTVAAS
jgi:hypothetical protein